MSEDCIFSEGKCQENGSIFQKINKLGPGAQEIIELPNVVQNPMAGQIAGVDQDVTLGDLEGPMESVCICNGDEFHGEFSLPLLT